MSTYVVTQEGSSGFQVRMGSPYGHLVDEFPTKEEAESCAARLRMSEGRPSEQPSADHPSH